MYLCLVIYFPRASSRSPASVGQMREICVWTVRRWSLSRLHLSHRVRGTKPEVRGHGGGPSRSKVYHSPRGRGAISQALQYTHELPSRVFSSPPLFLIPPNGPDKNKKGGGLLTAASETNCGVWSSKPSVGGFTLKRFSFTHCPLHQSEGPAKSRCTRSGCPLTLPAVVGLFCFWLFPEDGGCF